MEDRIINLYLQPDISEYEDVHLLTLRESCAMLEERLNEVLPSLSDYDRQTIEAYIDLRNELEYQSVKTALRIGRNYCKK